MGYVAHVVTLSGTEFPFPLRLYFSISSIRGVTFTKTSIARAVTSWAGLSNPWPTSPVSPDTDSSAFTTSQASNPHWPELWVQCRIGTQF